MLGLFARQMIYVGWLAFIRSGGEQAAYRACKVLNRADTFSKEGN
jgi:hypothetical protein